MAGKKKQEVQLQREIETQEEWEECMAREGIWVVDVYQEWCGPCLALVTNFRRLKNELGDPLLNYAIAKADTIDALEKYRGRCEPTFLFYAGGILVSFVHGANAPKIQRTITEQLAQEHKVLEGQAERKEVKDTVLTRAAEKEIAAKEAEEMERELEGGHRSPSADGEEPKGITVAIIKPDVVAAGKVDEIIQEITSNGIEILANEERELTEDEATELYKELEDEKYFNDLIKFVCSGPCRLLVLTKGNTGETVVNDWREVIGPTKVETAKEEAPDSLRAKYGDQGYVNALHGSSTKEAAARELAFFFPQMAIPTYKKKRENIQRTLAIIKTEAFSEKKDEILAKISEAGFKIAMYKEIQITKDQAAEFYKEFEGQSYFEPLVESLCSSAVLALCLAGDEAIGAWKDMMGPESVDDAIETAPESLRARYTVQGSVSQFHGSDNEERAKKELEFFFPMEETLAVIKPGAMGTKEAIVDRIQEAGFRIAARKETTITQDIAEILYPKQADKEYYDDLVQSMVSGPTMFMVLTREDAINGWRQAIGDTDPEEAKANNPTSIRAQFGQDILNNAVHGSSTRDNAHEAMKAVFGQLEFNDDGTIKGQEPELEEATEALKIDRGSPVAETAPEYRDGEGDTTADETTADTTQDVTADTTADQTADQTTDQTVDQTTDQTQEPTTTAADETTADTTAAEETTAEETTAEETEAETTQGDTTVADTTMEATVDETQGDTTQADETQADATVGDTTAGDVTQDEPTATATEPETTVGETTTEDNTKTADDATSAKGGDEEEKKEEDKKEENTAEEPSVKGEEPKEEETQKEGGEEETKNEESKEETKQVDGNTESSETKEVPDKGDATTTDQATTES